MDDVLWMKRGESEYSATTAYCASRLPNVMFAKAFARRWSDVESNALDPGWVLTKMGGNSASGNTDAAVEVYVMLAEGEEELTRKSVRYMRPGKRENNPHKATEDEKAQDRLLEICAGSSGVKLS
jgi:NAD(P)-dependent dehydrogenase (short-subunit alcohol dehydrogenase family)